MQHTDEEDADVWTADDDDYTEVRCLSLSVSLPSGVRSVVSVPQSEAGAEVDDEEFSPKAKGAKRGKKARS